MEQQYIKLKNDNLRTEYRQIFNDMDKQRKDEDKQETRKTIIENAKGILRDNDIIKEIIKVLLIVLAIHILIVLFIHGMSLKWNLLILLYICLFGYITIYILHRQREWKKYIAKPIVATCTPIQTNRKQKGPIYPNDRMVMGYDVSTCL